jgi:hypothetical protein
MLGFIIHLCAAVFFFCMSLASGARVFFYGHDLLPGAYTNSVGLCVVSGLVWFWAAMRAKEAWYISRCNRNA